MVGSVGLVIFAVIWLPILRRRELKEISEARSQPIHVNVSGSLLLNEDGSQREIPIPELSVNTKIRLKKILGQDEISRVTVVNEDAQILGYLPDDIGSELELELAANNTVGAKIEAVNGGVDGDPEYDLKCVLEREIMAIKN